MGSGSPAKGPEVSTATQTNLFQLPPIQRALWIITLSYSWIADGLLMIGSAKLFPSRELTMSHSTSERQVYKLVLTGGPCGGKTTGQARLSTFFENLGWKVFRVPECSTILQSGGAKFPEMNKGQAYQFQENLLKCLLQMEDTYFMLAEEMSQNTLIICDRGAMDPSAFLPENDWQKMKSDNHWDALYLRDGRYHQVIHLVTAANGAEDFYTVEDHAVRHENADLARHLDNLAAQAWVGHPYYDVVDNSTDFEGKVIRMISAVCHRMGVDPGDRLNLDSKKKKYLIRHLPDMKGMKYQEFDVVHDYLVTPYGKMQARIRRRGQNGSWTYTHTIRRPKKTQEHKIEVKQEIDFNNYQLLLAQRDDQHYTIVKKRRCFLWNNQYYQMDIYLEPVISRCKDLILLETYTARSQLDLPDFMEIVREVTDDPNYSMYTLSMKDSHHREIIVNEMKNGSCSDASVDTLANMNGIKSSISEVVLNGGNAVKNSLS